MTKRVIIIPYKMGSKSTRLLKEGLIAEGINCIRRMTTNIKPLRNNDLLIYYGGVDVYPTMRPQADVLNERRWTAQNKLQAFQAFQNAGLSTVKWTTDAAIAATWPIAVARATLTGHSGQGITVHEQGQPLPTVPLYTKYQKKTYECRIHVFNGKVIDAQVKRKRTTDNQEETNPYIRNIHTGWVYCRENFILPESAKELAIAACTAVGLDFGAVDLIYNRHYNQFYLLEINTAPGLEGTTLTNYIKEIKNVL
jgi:hypothetical protein